MKINSVGAAQNFGKVFAVAGTKEKTNKLKTIISQSEGKADVYEATDMYRNATETKGACSKAASRGKQVNFVVTGTNDTEKAAFMETGWTSLGGISQHIDKFIDLHNVKADVKPIQKAMKKDV